MKRPGLASIFSLLLLSLTTPRLATAQSASGTYRFLFDDDLTRSIEFDARTDERGVTAGSLSFVDTAKIPDVDDPEDPRGGDAPPELYVKAELDTLVVEKNRALMSGTIRDSSHRTYIGQWVQLVVEDNGREPDKLVWWFCKPPATGWIPSDAELKNDNGAYLRWWATDAERKDDVGIPSKNLIPGEEKSCPVYPLSVYSFAEILKWEGDIIVQP